MSGTLSSNNNGIDTKNDNENVSGNVNGNENQTENQNQNQNENENGTGNESSNEPPMKKIKTESGLDDSNPTFDFGITTDSSSQNIENSKSTPSEFTSDSTSAFDSAVKNSDGLSLPKSVAPSTDLKKDAIPTSNSGLALPKKNEKKGKTTGGKNVNKKESGKPGAKGSQSQTDASKMSDVLFSAGVDIREEEALLTSSVAASKTQSQPAAVNIPEHPPFLHPDQVAAFMKKASKEQNFNQNFAKQGEILQMISSSCENYMRDIITNTIVISRHRRKAVKVNSGRRSEVAIALKSIAIQQKKDEERRVKKRIALGLEKEDTENKIDSEETLHRASNATAGLRAGSKKQYGWLTSSTNKPLAATGKGAGNIAAAIAARGDTGLRFREAREEPGIVMRDLLNALENRRIGSHNIITKGYARIRD
ncbi:hypothetical protein Kpol_1037p13 [Vanderwaltozyma polyspora DSM 70294]|uniref:Transcription initiation factor TFIID subunit 4 n=1 Tax=Vanderwaltozyma polyspora (strain ATCC 22028 / DSM 70294 / BCRC 21397 / CBS 2163 / NBRC 10782 / NRRL Y-8283 / UCD 57-17) TaxID=436907 RepID=TAF4_VANPO|nr:uncharacterized protein Kpol_1037p13 [Vanderwaltozyma polyspora DSM 70294]A7TJV5.1 RecName: Full=Transcription initiation factor TFIID subunit 4; AltName: Full=TBP-associated factor 4 [Vanderwaltozyma polyspora DSM 70294]EDO17417.1 hypothetical protein Kpol_1037p13 [Vanderwaltozyma polyspora DSM 70294]